MKPSEIAEGIMATADGGKSGLGIRADHVESLARAYLRLREAVDTTIWKYDHRNLIEAMDILRKAMEESHEDI
jgi:hypothetical protein